MTKLLVSVRDAAEAREALAAGAALIDVKEPRHGSLGAATPACWREVRQAVAGRVPVSAALGELLEPELPERARHLPLLAYAKIGLAGCASQPGWAQRWRRVWQQIPRTTDPVAVIYADWQAAHAPPPCTVLAEAVTVGARMLLIDTWDKRGGWLLSNCSAAQLRQIVARARDCQLGVVLAGSLRERHLPALLPLAPDWIAVRAAVCDGHRTNRVVGSRVRRLVCALEQAARPALQTGRR